METTVGQVIINDMLPEDMRDYNRIWDKKTKGKVLTDLARRHPNQFKEVSHNLLRFGAKAAYETGGQSFGIEDIAPTQISRDFQRVMGQQLQDILARAYKKGKTSQDPEVQQEIADAAIPWMKKIDDGINEELGWENPFYRQAYGTGAQKPGTLRSIVGADVFYVDQNNKRVPIPVTHGYAQGLTPAEYFIQSFGTRKGMVDLQKATQDAGFLSKQLVQIAHRLVVTDKDDDTAFDPESPVGYPVDTDDPDNEGSCLAEDIGGYKRNTLLTPKILGDLKNRGFDRILIRSVMVGGPANGGVYSLDCGVRESGSLPNKGDFVGINAVQAISEPLTQGAISCLDPETEVRMGNATVKKLKDIKVGDTVLGASKDGRAFPAKVTNVFNNGIQPVYQTTFRQKEYPWKRVTVRATMEHKILQVKNMENPEAKQTIAPIGIGAKDPAAIIHQFGGQNLKYARYESHFIGDIETLDIEVDCEDHLFILANGLIVSNSKHSGGVAGADSGKAISGFKYVNQLIQVPKHFPGGAVHSEVDGTVTKIEDAPQGGKYIYVNGEKHYVGRSDEKDIPITVKVGDKVEAGDVMTEGIPNPAMVVKYKGIGEGRRYFTNMFREALNNAGTPIHRRNIEMLSRGLINYIRLTDEVGDYAPDDILPYSMIEKDYKPREDARVDSPEILEGQYLERPILHYSIGTKLRPSVIKELKEFGIKRVIAHPDPPPFEAEMIRGMAHVSKDPDWATRLLGAYNKDSLLEGARRGATSSAESTSYVPAITFGEKDFGHIGPLKQGSVKQADMATPGVFYSSPEAFNNSGNQFNSTDRIKLPTGDIFRTDVTLDASDKNLQNVFNTTKSIHDLAPNLNRSNYRTFFYWDDDPATGGINLFSNIGINRNRAGTSISMPQIYGHEFTHDFTPGGISYNYLNQILDTSTLYKLKNDYNATNDIYTLNITNPENTRLYNVEQPTTAADWGYNAQNLPKDITPFDMFKIFNVSKEFGPVAQQNNTEFKLNTPDAGFFRVLTAPNQIQGLRPQLSFIPDNASADELLTIAGNLYDKDSEPSIDDLYFAEDSYADAYADENSPLNRFSYKGFTTVLPYGRYMPTYGPMGVNHSISPEEWVSYTIPGVYDPVKEQFTESNLEENNINTPDYSNIRKGLNMTQLNKFYNLLGKYKLPTTTEEVEQAKKIIEDSPEFHDYYYKPKIEEFMASAEMQALYKELDEAVKLAKERAKDWSTSGVDDPVTHYVHYEINELVRANQKIKEKWDEFFRKNKPDQETLYKFISDANPDELGKAYGLKPLENEQELIDQLAFYYMNHRNIKSDLLDDYDNLPKDQQEALDLQTKDLFGYDGASLTAEQRRAILHRIKELRQETVDDLQRELFFRGNWLLRHANLGLNTEDGETTPFAGLQGASERIDPVKKYEWARLHGQIMQRINQYRKNPRYLNVMRNWELSPNGTGYGLVGNNKPMLTIAQMKQILQELDQEDKNYQLENSQPFQGGAPFYQHYMQQLKDSPIA